MSDIHGTREELVAMIVCRSEEARVANAVAQMERDCSAANRAEIERLRAAERNYQAAHDLQNEKIERLRTALKPFADIADLVNHTERRDGERVFELPRKPPAVGYFTLVREDFRRAAQALEQKEDKAT